MQRTVFENVFIESSIQKYLIFKTHMIVCKYLLEAVFNYFVFNISVFEKKNKPSDFAAPLNNVSQL